ncbi:hypothetical protein BD410DRAFT_786129 [Rickenella mellea]|uniref:Uncharacterized protein n=1 Tax=Rickenella mellea TaxID=50990 RepID=A0A4Y7QCN6_9AGAM|nr:hypothetical protein BD410DRAFT_786129 [Rickenella mellea]
MIFFYIRDLATFVISLILPGSSFRRLIPRRDHFAAHPHTRFEGYYTRIQIADKSTIVLIFSSVPKASNGTSHLVHFSLNPSKASKLKAMRVDLYPPFIRYSETTSKLHDGRQSFRLEAAGIGTLDVGHERQTFELDFPNPDNPNENLQISINITNRTPLDPKDVMYTPHGRVVHVDSLIPLHWHIFSTHSAAEYVVRCGNAVICEGEGAAHLEKNWGKGFPDSWTWMQAFSSPDPAPGRKHNPRSNPRITTLALAGGKILGIKAYMAVYRSATLQWDFAVPWTILLGRRGWSLTMKERIRSNSCGVDLDICTPTRRLVVQAQGSKDLKDWLHLDCPLFDGHGNVTARENFSACISVEAHTRSVLKFWKGWHLVERTILTDAALEFGGEYRSTEMVEADRILENAKFR